MVNDINTCTITGTVAYQPKIGTSKAGKPYAMFKLRVGKSFKGKDYSSVIGVKAWGDVAAGLADSFLAEGARVLVTGSLGTSSFEKDGKTQYTTEVTADGVVQLGAKSLDTSNSNYSNTDSSDDDDIPF